MIYETDADRERESEFKLRIESRFNCELIKLSYDWQFDFLIARNKLLTGIAEIKVRTHESTKYETVIFSEHKAKSGFSFCKKTLCFSQKDNQFRPPSFIFFVRFTDKAMYCQLEQIDFGLYERVKLSAKNHAGDPTDTEWVRYIPISKFKEF